MATSTRVIRCAGRNLRLGLVALVLGVPGAVSAEGFWYLGAGAGLQLSGLKRSQVSETPPSCDRPTFSVPFGDCRVTEDDSAGSYGLFAGYQATEYLGIELGFANLSDTFSLRVEDPLPAAPAFTDVEQSSRAFSVRGVFTLPLRQVSQYPWLEPMSVSGVVGVARWRSDITYLVDNTGTPARFPRPLSFSETQSGNSLMFGARVNYDINERVRVSGAWDHYEDVGRAPVAIAGRLINAASTVNTISGSVDVLSVMLSYRFR